jgi:hypothetical protein
MFDEQPELRQPELQIKFLRLSGGQSLLLFGPWGGFRFSGCLLAGEQTSRLALQPESAGGLLAHVMFR